MEAILPPALPADGLAASRQPRPSKTPEERRIAWAWTNQDEAAALLRASVPALAATARPQLYGPDADSQIVSPDAWLLYDSAHLSHISSLKLLHAAERLGILAHAVEHYRPNSRKNPILASGAAGRP